MGAQEGRRTFILPREAAADSVRRAQSPRIKFLKQRGVTRISRRETGSFNARESKMLLRRTPARVEREKEVDGVVTPDNIEKLVSKHDNRH